MTRRERLERKIERRREWADKAETRADALSEQSHKGALETVGVGFIPNKKLRRIVQIGLIGVHVALGTKNLKGGL